MPAVELDALADGLQWPAAVTAAANRSALSHNPALGRLAELAVWLGSAQGKVPPDQPARIRGIIVGSEPDAAVSADADALGVGLRHVPGRHRDLAGAISAGAELADDEIDAGSGLLLVARASVDAADLAAVSVIIGTEPVRVLARGAAATDPGQWMKRASAVRDLHRRGAQHDEKPSELLEALGSPILAFTTALLLRAAARRTPVVLDGVAVTAAALIAGTVRGAAAGWWFPADSSSDPAAELALRRLRLTPALNLDIALGDGTAALATVPVLRAAVARANATTALAGHHG